MEEYGVTFIEKYVYISVEHMSYGLFKTWELKVSLKWFDFLITLPCFSAHYDYILHVMKLFFIEKETISWFT